MDKIIYTNDIVEQYPGIFGETLLLKWNKQWGVIRGKMLKDVKPSCYYSSVFPEKIESILNASPKELVNIFVAYHNNIIKGRIGENLHKQLIELFNYSSNQPRIAHFIMRNAEKIGIHSCFYCELSYINAYSTMGKKYNHFDLDHFLPKSECPIVSLSINNLIPSCSVCNEKLKHEHILGIQRERETGILTEVDRENILHLFPTDSNYHFDTAVTLTIKDLRESTLTRSLRRKQEMSENYSLDFCTAPGQEVYQDEIDLFRLNERYNYHKMEALRLFDLYNEYPHELRKQISDIFKGAKTPKEVADDLFGTDFSRANHRCFDKIRRDIARKFGEQ